jgi:hypothetical protein
MICVVCKKPSTRVLGMRKIPFCADEACVARFEAYTTERPNHSLLEREAARARFGQREDRRDDE